VIFFCLRLVDSSGDNLLPTLSETVAFVDLNVASGLRISFVY
jgi:hypothetical protein